MATKKRGVKTAAILSAVAALLPSCVNTRAQGAALSPAQAVEQYLSAVAAGQHQKAYDLLSADDRAAISLTDFSKKTGSEFKVVGERNRSAEVAVETMGPDPKAFQEYMNGLMDGRLSVDEIKERLDQALHTKKFPLVKATMHYLVVYEDGAWRIVTGHGVRAKMVEVSKDADAFSGSMQRLLRATPALEPRVGPVEDVTAELAELQRQNALLWQGIHDLQSQVSRRLPSVGTKPSAEPVPTRPKNYASFITASGPREFQLRRELMDIDPNQWAQAARIVPSFVEGKPNGFKVLSIRAGSLYALLGFENGDIVKTINGIALVNPDAVFRAYESLKTAKKFDVSLIRAQEPVVLRYSIVENR